MTHARRLTLAHLWVAFGAFAVAAVLGVWQMWARSPLPAPGLTAHNYFTSVTAHGVFMAYVLTTFTVMGFGYYVAETALGRPAEGATLARKAIDLAPYTIAYYVLLARLFAQRLGRCGDAQKTVDAIAPLTPKGPDRDVLDRAVAACKAGGSPSPRR